MPYDTIDSADMAEMALSQAVDEHIENSKEIIDKITSLEEAIKNWNMKDARELKVHITNMRHLLAKHFQVQIENFMNMKAVPSGQVSEQIKKAYKIVAVDEKGIALYGPEMDKVASLSKIIDHYKKRIQSQK